MTRHLLPLLLSGLLATAASAQFTGPSVAAPGGTVAQARQKRVGTYLTLTGNIVAHQRGDYFSFRDRTGEIRVEIGNEVFNNQRVGPDTKVRLAGEVDVGLAGRYVWVRSLDIVPGSTTRGVLR